MNRLGRVVAGVLAVALTVFALHATAAETQTAGRDFNHLTTGFPLTGGHATTPCETCHLGGVFKGTPRTCDGCHALGKRIVATPKSTGHIVTDGPCETCHFNTSTFLGARFNHGTALPGQCKSCHNGRQSARMPANHTSLAQMTSSCDQCHRTYSWLPASWNHVGVTPGSCESAGCHVQGSNQYYRAKHTISYNLMRANSCDDCHTVVSWIPRHMAQTKTCSGCHNTLDAIGKPLTHGITTAECNTCHTNTVTWLGASYHNGATAGICGTCHGTTPGVMGKPAGSAHIPTTGNNCDLCHTSLTSFAVYKMDHAGSGNMSSCVPCHATTSPYPVITKITTGSSHNGSTALQECANCHASTSTWLGAAGAMPKSHIPFNAGAACVSCHTSGYTALVSITTLHSNSATHTCAECHISPNAYTGNNQKTKSNHKGSSGNNCSSCHKQAASYSNWSD